MADAPTIVHRAIPDLDGLLHRLRRDDGLRIGMDRQIIAASLLRRLAKAGVLLSQPDVAADWLAPVLCTNARDQGALRARIEAEMPAAESESAGSEAAAERIQPVQAVERAEAASRAVGRNWLLGALAAGAITGLLVFLISQTTPTLDGPIETGGNPTSLGLGFLDAWLGQTPVLLGIAIVFVMPIFIVRSRRRERVRAATSQVGDAAPVPSGSLPWFQEASLRTSLRALRQHVSPFGRFLNLPQTIRSTVRHGGIPVIVRGGRPKLPEHVVLAQLSHAEDQIRVPVEALLRCLGEGGVHSDAYAFFGAFNVVHNWSTGEVESLPPVALRHHGARLLVVSDGRPFYNRLADTATRSAALEDFSERILLVPEFTEPPSPPIQALRRAGWLIVEFRSDGVRQIADWLLSPREFEMDEQDEEIGLDRAVPRLDIEPMLVDGRRTPSPQRIALLMEQLREWLGDRAFAFLCVLAVQPQISPIATDAIAGHLTTLGVPAPDEAALARMTNLPWMRRGELPTWLRAALVERIPADLRETARTAWLLYLAGESAPRRYSTATAAAAVAPGDLAHLHTIALARVNASDRSDPFMTELIGEPAGLPNATQLLSDIDWRTSIAALLSAVTTAIAIYSVTTKAHELLLLILAASQRIEPFVPSVTTMGVIVLGALFFTPSSRIMAQVLAVAAAPIAMILVLAAPAEEARISVRLLCLAEALVAAIAYRRLAADPPSQLAARALLSPAHPWINAAVVLALVGYAAASNLQSLLEVDTVVLWLAHEAAMFGIGACMAWSLATRMVGQGAASRSSAARAAMLYMVGQALAGALLLIAFDMLDPYDAAWFKSPVLWWLIDASARLIGGISIALICFEQPGWQRDVIIAQLSVRITNSPIASILVFAIGTMFAVLLPLQLAFGSQTRGIAEYFGVSPTSLQVIGAYGPWLATALIGTPLASSEKMSRSDRVQLLAMFGLLAAVVAGPLVVPVDVSELPAPWLYGQASWLANWLSLWPIVLVLRPNLVVSPRDGLWWRCLLLIPCSVAILKLGGILQLAVPIAAWIAARHGARAPPALSLALVPMMLCVRLDLSVVVVSPGLGWALAALLAAMFATDSGLRASILAQDRLTTAQLAVLCLSTIELEVGIPTLRFHADLYPLAITLLAFIGLSGVPIRRLVVLFAFVELIGVLLDWGSRLVHVPTIYRVVLGFPGIPGFVNVVLVLVIARLIRSVVETPLTASSLRESGSIAAAMSRRPGFAMLRERLLQIDLPGPVQRLLQVLLDLRASAGWVLVWVMLLDCFFLNLSIAGVSIDPFVRYQIVIVMFALGAADRMGLLPAMPWTRLLERVPQSHRTAIVIGLAVLLFTATPTLDLSLLPFQIKLGTPFSGGGLTQLLVAVGFFYIGRRLPDLIAPRSLSAAGSANLWQTLPVRAGAGVGVLCIVIALAVSVVALVYEPIIPTPLPLSPSTETPTPVPSPPPPQTHETPGPAPTATVTATPTSTATPTATVTATPTSTVTATPVPGPSPTQPQATPSPAPTVQAPANQARQSNLPPFRCVPSKNADRAFKAFLNPETGEYDRVQEVPLSECLSSKK